MKKLFFLVVILLMGLTISNKAQGCSDAGFCTLDHLKPDQASSDSFNNKLKFGFSFGKADNSVTALGQYIEYSRAVTNSLDISTKLTSLLQSGNDISEFGISDLFLSASYKIKEYGLIGGVKIPLSDGNKMDNGVALPMDYQASLGTLDLILGFSTSFDKLQIMTALQLPLTQNENQFVTIKNSDFEKFISTNGFERKGDLLLRIAYPLILKEQYDLTLSLLPIYHLGNDEYTNLNGDKSEIDGSDGLTLNFNMFFNYNISETNRLQINLGMPFIIRDERPDGLTRSFIATVEYLMRF